MSNTIPQGRLILAPHVRACDCANGVILLDLRRSQYLGVGGALSRALSARVEGWPTRNDTLEVAASPESQEEPEAQETAVRSLLSQGVLTEDSVGPAPANSVERANASIDLGTAMPPRFPGARRTLRFTTSVASAAWRLRYQSLQTITNAISARRERQIKPWSDSLEAMRPGLRVYDTLRPFVFTAREKCLLDSLALVTFLARDGLFPRWVVGIKTGPFGAHSWVQCGCTVLNDQHEYVRQFRPILVV